MYRPERAKSTYLFQVVLAGGERMRSVDASINHQAFLGFPYYFVCVFLKTADHPKIQQPANRISPTPPQVIGTISPNKKRAVTMMTMMGFRLIPESMLRNRVSGKSTSYHVCFYMSFQKRFWRELVQKDCQNRSQGISGSAFGDHEQLGDSWTPRADLGLVWV